MKDRKKEAWVLFWGRVLSPVLFRAEEDTQSERQLLRALCQEEFVDPEGRPRRISLSTLKRKLKGFRQEGTAGLEAKRRSDLGSIRASRDAILERAIELKRAHPLRSEEKINLLLRHEGLAPLPASTLRRHFLHLGVTRRKLGYEGGVIRRRWTRAHTHSLWVGDFSDGPRVIDAQGVARRTWISAFIDVHSRFIVAGVYALTCNMEALIASLIAAFEQHGTPKALYLDNAKVYRTPILARACLDLRIELIHRAVREPEGGGVIERFFLSLQRELESELALARVPLDLARLNEAFAAWVAEVYHARPHSETGQSPLVRYRAGLLHPVAPLRAEQVRPLFCHQEQRTVDRDFSDITLEQRFYRVDPALRGDRVIVRYPLAGPLTQVSLFSLRTDEHLGYGELHDRSTRRVLPAPPAPVEDVDYIQILTDIHARTTAARDMPTPPLHTRWDLATFVVRICAIAGANPDELSAQELEILKRILDAHPAMNAALLKRIWARCEPRTLQTLLLSLATERIDDDL